VIVLVVHLVVLLFDILEASQGLDALSVEAQGLDLARLAVVLRARRPMTRLK